MERKFEIIQAAQEAWMNLAFICMNDPSPSPLCCSVLTDHTTVMLGEALTLICECAKPECKQEAVDIIFRNLRERLDQLEAVTRAEIEEGNL